MKKSCSKNSGSSRRLQCFRKGVGVGLRSKTRKKKLTSSQRRLYCGKKRLSNAQKLFKINGDNYSCLHKGIAVGQTKKRARKSKKRRRKTSRKY